MRTFGKELVKIGIRTISAHWSPYSRLILAGDNAGWVLDSEIGELHRIAENLGIRTVPKFGVIAPPHRHFF